MFEINKTFERLSGLQDSICGNHPSGHQVTVQSPDSVELGRAVMEIAKSYTYDTSAHRDGCYGCRITAGRP